MNYKQSTRKENMTKQTVTIKKDRLPYLREKITKLNRKCFKLNCPEMVLIVNEKTETICHELLDGRHISREDLVKFEIPVSRIARTWVEVEVTLEYEIPVIDGWELICTFDIAPGPPVKDENGEVEKDKNGNTVYGDPTVFTSKVPDKELPEWFLNKHEIHCDHCGHKRYRTHSMLMKKVESGRHKEVGSTCVKDFFGHDPKALLWMAQISFTDIIDEIEGEYFGSGGGTSCYDLDQVLAYTALAIRKDGWVSKGMAYDDPGLNPTADNIFYYMKPPKSEVDKLGIEVFTPTEEDINLAKAAVKHFEEIEVGDNDYLMNCKKVAALGYVPIKMIGTACSMIATYRRELAKKLEKDSLPESNFVGQVKDKIEVTGKCVWLTEVQSMYGVSVLYIFVDETTGNKFKTFYSGKSWSANQGDIVKIKGTVKKHEEYKGEKNTMLTRVFGEVIS
jgi:hypothetical protein